MADHPFADRELHFVGIGGAGMSGLALVAKELGAAVTGSDRAESSNTARLREHGIEPAIGHDAANVPEGAQVVVSTAIAHDNPELRGHVLHRGELLGEVSRLKKAIAVAGTHGKTTTCGMVAHALIETGRRPAYLIGGELRATHTNAAWGEGEWIVVEADESDRSFLELNRDVAVVTNVELDHHHTYRSMSELEEAFRAFTETAETVIEEDHLNAEDLELHEMGSSFSVDGVFVELAVPGRHNVANALSALGACRAAGVPIAEAAPALASFEGTGRRFEPRGITATGARVFDDYAHHPTEVAATLDAARTLRARRVIACFQPHLFSRTKMLARRFGEALAKADLIAVLDVYPARERAEDFPGVSGLTVARAVADAARGRRVMWTPSIEDAAARLAAEAGDGDVVLTLGAGNVDRVAELLVR